LPSCIQCWAARWPLRSYRRCLKGWHTGWHFPQGIDQWHMTNWCRFGGTDSVSCCNHCFTIFHNPYSWDVAIYIQNFFNLCRLPQLWKKVNKLTLLITIITLWNIFPIRLRWILTDEKIQCFTLSEHVTIEYKHN